MVVHERKCEPGKEKTKLNQSGDVDGGNSAKSVLVAATGANVSANASVPKQKRFP